MKVGFVYFGGQFERVSAAVVPHDLGIEVFRYSVPGDLCCRARVSGATRVANHLLYCGPEDCCLRVFPLRLAPKCGRGRRHRRRRTIFSLLDLPDLGLVISVSRFFVVFAVLAAVSKCLIRRQVPW